MMPGAYIFGEHFDDFIPEKERLASVAALAETKKAKIRSASVREIIGVLDDFSRSWRDPGYAPRREAWNYLKGQTGYSDEMLSLGFDAVAYITSRRFLEKRLATELREPNAAEMLDAPFFSREFNGMQRIVPVGTLLHVSASNVFISAVDSLVSGFITKNVNILKLSRGDVEFPLIFARALRDLDKGCVFSDCFAALYFEGGSSEAESALRDAVDGIVVWGGAEAVSAWRRNASIRARVIEYGPKISFSFIDLGCVHGNDDLSRLCDAIASDVSIWEQAACSSPQNAFIVESDEIDAERFCLALLDSLLKKAEELPFKSLSQDEGVEILKGREKAYAEYIHGRGRLYYKKGAPPCTVVFSKNKEAETSPLMRTIVVKRVDSFDEFHDALSKIGFYLQAVSIRVADNVRADLADRLFAAGANRVTYPGCHAAPPDGSPHDGKHLLSQLVRFAAYELPSFEEQKSALLRGSEAAAAASRSKLAAVLRIAHNETPYYRGVIPGGILSLPSGSREFMDAFKKIPLLGKKEIYGNCLPESTDIIAGGDLSDAFVFASGGSTGDPKFSVYSTGELEYVTDVLASIYKVAGISPRNRVANLFIAGGLWTSFIVANMAVEKIGATNLPIGGNTDFETIHKFFKKLRPDAIVGLPSIIVRFAEFCESHGGGVEVPLVLYGGEHMRKPARELLARVLKTRSVVSAGYAAVDCGPIGFQCGHMEGGVHHELSEYQFVEILRGDGTDAPPGEPGEIVVTNIGRSRMPVIRFATGDSGVWLDRACPCGRGDRVFELLGRCDDILVIGSSNITPRDFEESIAEIPELSSVFQICGVMRGRTELIELSVELRDGVPLSDELAASIASRLAEALPRNSYKLKNAVGAGWMPAPEIIVKPAGGIERVARTGKVRTVVDRRRN